MKCPSRKAPASRKTRSTSDGSIGTTTYSAEVRALTVIPSKEGSGAVRDVADPEAGDGEVLVDVIRVGIDGTDSDIARGEYGTAAQRRMTVWEPRRAVVLGAGTVGILAALVFRLRGLDVTVVDRRDKPERRDLVTRIGATYAATSTTPLSEIAGNGVDLAFEATGSAEVAFAAMNILGRNGALILASVTGGHRSLTVPADDVNQRLVLGNVLVVGTA